MATDSDSTLSQFEGVLALVLGSYRKQPPDVQLAAERLRDQIHLACPDLSADQLGRAAVAVSVALSGGENVTTPERVAVLQAVGLLGGSLLQEFEDG